jgi:hypothetical protein
MAEACKLIYEDDLTGPEAARQLGVHRATLYRAGPGETNLPKLTTQRDKTWQSEQYLSIMHAKVKK